MGEPNIDTCVCHACGADSGVERKPNVGAVAEASGFSPYLSRSGHMYWLCPRCNALVVEPLQQIIDVFGIENAEDVSLIGQIMRLCKERRRSST